jgi:hypothetical protein
MCMCVYVHIALYITVSCRIVEYVVVCVGCVCVYVCVFASVSAYV